MLEYRESTRPRMVDLRESGSLEQDANKVLLLHRPSYYDLQMNPNAVDTGVVGAVTSGANSGRPAIVTAVPYPILAKLAIFSGVLRSKSAIPATARYGAP